MENKNQNTNVVYSDLGGGPSSSSVAVAPDPLNDPQALSLTPTPYETMPDPAAKKQDGMAIARRGGIVAVAFVLMIGLGWVLVSSTQKSKAPSVNNIASDYDTQQIPLGSFTVSDGITALQAKLVAINGTLEVNEGLIVSPSVQPADAQPGQIYFDQDSKQLAYYNGTGFIALPGADTTTTQNVESLGGLTGQVAVGAGLSAVGGQLTNSGVLTVQGQSGNVTLNAGTGIAISGTTITNAGVVSVASGSPAIVVSNDGNGNITLTGSGSGTVSSLGGTTGRLAKFTGPQSIGDSLITESGVTVTVNGDLSVVTGGLSLSNALTVSNGGTGATSLATNGVIVGQGTGALTSVVAGGPGLCLLSTAGAPNFGACPSAGGVTTLNGLSGAVSIANASGAGSVVTIDDATTGSKGIASFNNTNFSVTAGAVNTIQNINSGATPTFAGVNTNSITPSAALTVGISAQTALLQGSTTTITSSGVGNDIVLNSADTIELQDNTNITGNLVASGDLAANGGDITSTGALNITPGGTLTAGVGSQTLTLQGNGSTTLRATDSGNTTIVGFANPTANTTLNFPALAAGTYTICTSGGGCAGATVTLQNAYDNSASPEIVLDATRGAVTIRDNATPLGANLLEVQNNGGGTTYLAVTSAGLAVTGTATISGNINSSGGVIQTNGATRLDNSGNLSNIGTLALSGAISGGTTYSGSGNINTTTGGLQTNSVTRVDNSGNLTNIGNLTLSGAISGGTTVTGSGNFNTTGGVIQTNSTTRIDNSGNLVNIAAITASGSATLQGGSVTLGTNAQAGSLVINDGSSNTGTLQVAALGQNTAYTLPDPGGASATICLSTGNCAGAGGGVTGSGINNRVTKFTSTGSTVGDSTISDDGTNVTTTVDMIIQGGDITLGTNGQLGSLVMHDGNGQSTTLRAGDSTGNLTFIFPTNAGGTNQCLKQSGTGNQLIWDACDGGGGGSSATLQTAYDNGNSITTTDARDIDIVLANTTTDSNLDIVVADDSTGFLSLARANGTGTNDPAQLVLLNNLDTDRAVPVAIRIQSAAGGMSTGIDATDAEIGDALSVGANNIIGTTGNIDFTNFDLVGATGNLSLTGSISGGTTVTGSGNFNTTGGVIQTNSTTRIDNSGNLVNIGSLTATGSATLQGGSATLGTNAQAGSLVVNDGSSNTGTLQVAALGQNTVYTLPDPGGASANICLDTGNCAGAGGGVTGSGTNNRITKFTSTGSTVGDSTISDDGTNVTTTVDMVIQGGDVTLGTTGQLGSLVMHDGNGQSTTLRAGDSTGNLVFIFPTTAGSTNQCLKQSGTGNQLIWDACDGGGGGSSGTLQTAYDNGNSIATTDARDIDITLANTTTDSNLDIVVADDSTGFLSLTRANGTGTNDPAQLVLLDNLDTDRAVPVAVRIQSAAGGISTGIDASDVQLTDALSVGANNIVGTTGNIDFSNFDLVGATGNLSLAGSISGGTTYSGSGNINTTGGGLQTNSVTRVDNSGNLVGIGNLTATAAITISSTGGGNAITLNSASTIELQDATNITGNTAITGTAADALIVRSSANGSGIVVLNIQQSDNDSVLRVTDTGTLAVGNATNTAGTVAIGNGASGFFGEIKSTNLTALRNYELPNVSGTFCTDAGNCGSSTGTLQAAYTFSTGGTTPEIKLDGSRVGIDVQDADTTIGAGQNFISFRGPNGAGLGSVLFGVGTQGNLFMQPSANRTDLIDVNTNGGGNLFVVDSTNSRVGIAQGGSTSPTYTLDVGGDANLAGGSVYRVGGTQISSSNLSNDANLAKLNASQTFTGNNNSFRNGADSTNAFSVQNALGNRILTVDSSNSELELGLASTLDGKIVFSNMSNANTVTIVPGTPTGARTLTLPDVSGIICTDSGNCAGVGATLQTGYNFSVGGTTPKIKVTSGLGSVDIQDADTPIGANLFNVRASNGSGLGSVMLGVGNTGQVALQNSANSTTALRLLTQGGTTVLTGDTTNGQIILGQSSTLNGLLVFNNATNANQITLTTAVASGPQTITLPNSTGTVCLTSGNCAGVGGTGDILQGGNSFTAAMTIGTNDAFDLNLETGGTTRLTVESDGSQVTLASNVDLMMQGASAYISNAQGSASGEAFGWDATVGGNGVAVGRQATAGTGGAFGSPVAMGYQASAASWGTAIGGQSSTTGDEGVALGNNATAAAQGTALGTAATTAGDTGSIAIGFAASTTAAGQLVIGSNNFGITHAVLGSGVTDATPSNILLQGTSGSGSDIAGASVTLAAGQGTGSALGGNIVFQSSLAGGSGSSLNGLTTLATLSTTSLTMGTDLDVLLQGSTAYISNPQTQSSSEAFGLNAAVSGSNAVALGNGAASAADGIAIGQGAAAVASAVAIGQVAGASSGAFGGPVSIGDGANGGSWGVAIGMGSSNTGNWGVAIGESATSSQNGVALGNTAIADSSGVAIGAGADTDGNNRIVIGYSSTATADNQLVIGGSSADGSYISDAYLGSGVTDATPQTITLQGTGGSGSNIAGANFNLAGGKSTGSANGGNLNFQISAPGGAGASLNSLTTVATLSGANGSALFKNAVDSATAFQIQNAASTSNLFVADTSLNRIGIGTASPQAMFHILASGTAGTPAIDSNTVAVFQRSSSGTTNSNVSIISGATATNSGIYFGDTADETTGGVRYSHATDILSLRAGGGNRLNIDSGRNHFFDENGNHTLQVQDRSTNAAGFSLTVKAAAGGAGAGANAGGNLTLQAGAGGGTNGNGGNLILAGGAKNGSGNSGSVIVRPAASNDSASALLIQNAAATETMFSADTAARSGSGGNLLKVGNSTGTDGATTILQLDAATADPTSNLAVLNGGLFYNSTTHKVSIIENGAVKELCNKTDLLCGAAATTTLQDAYDDGNTITTTDARDIDINLADTATDSNFLVDLQCDTACGGNGRFAIQDDGADVFSVSPAGGAAVFQNATDSDQAFRVNNTGGLAVLRVDTASQQVAIGLSTGAIPSKLYVTSGTEVGLRVNLSGANTNNIFELARSTVNVMTVGIEGATLFKNSTDSANAFQVQNAAGASGLNVNTLTTDSNQMPNGDFEFLSAQGWAVRGSADQLLVEDTFSQFGRYSLHLRTQSANGNGVEFRTGFKPSTQYSLSMWVRRSASSAASFNIGRADNGSDTDCLTNQTFNTTWTQFTCTFTTGATIGQSSNFYVKQTDTSSDEIYIDGVTLVASATPLTYTSPASGLQVEPYYNNMTINYGNNGELQPWQNNQATLNAVRSRAGVATYNGYVYVLGGGTTIDGQTVASTNTVQYAKLNADGSVGTFTNNANNLATNVSGAGAVAMNGYIYMIGGKTANSDSTNNTATVQFAKLNADGSTGTWTTTGVSALPDTRGDVGVAAYNGYIYVVGGYDNGVGDTASTYYAKVNADGTISSWSTGNSLTNSITTAGATVVAANGYLYTLGGGGGGTGNPYVSVAKINSNGSVGTWTNSIAGFTPAMPDDLIDHAATVMNGHIYVFGGWNGSAVVNAVYYAQIKPDGSTSNWFTGANPLPNVRENMEAATANGYIYLFGGDDSTGTPTRSTVFYASGPRLKVGGALDLVGLSGENLAEGGTGGELTAGNTNIIGTLKVQEAVQFMRGLNVDGAVAFAAGNDSTGAFAVMNAAGVSQFVIDTTNSRTYIGNPTADATGALLVFDTKNTSADPTGVNGAMYYNSSTQQYRCYRGVNSTAADGLWEACGINPIDRGWVIQDEFFGGDWDSGEVGELGWTTSDQVGTPALTYNAGLTPTANHPGTLEIATSATNGGGITMNLDRDGLGSMIIAAGNNVKSTAGLDSTLNNAILRVGLHDERNSNARPVSGVWWEAANSVSTRWQFCYGDGSTATCSNAGSTTPSITATTWYRLEIRVTATGTNTSAADFFIDGQKFSVSGVTIDTTNHVNPAIACWNSTAAARFCNVDYYQFSGISSAAR